MCKARSDGGQRCAAYARPRYERTPITDPAWEEVAAEYASTREGRHRLLTEADDAAAAGDYNTEGRLRAAVRRGDSLRQTNREVASRAGSGQSNGSHPANEPTAVPGPGALPGQMFTDADRRPQDADQSFGISDHTVRLDPTILVPYRDKDASTRPRDPARMDALRADVAEHGIGNPLALFHDGKRACLAEGNHRLAVALEQDLGEVPLRIIRLRSLNEVSNFAKDSKPISRELRPFLR